MTWWAALLAWAALTAATATGMAWRATAPDLGPELQAVLLDAAFVAVGDVPQLVAAEPAVVAEDPFEPLPGAGWWVPLIDLPQLEATAVRARLADTWAAARVAGPDWLDDVTDPDLRAELDALDAAVLRPLAEAELRRALLPLGLDDGTRAADWRTQAARAPGAAVQPLVGVLVRLPVDQVEGAGPRLVGERVLAGLATAWLDEGRAAAEALLANAALSAAFAAVLDGPVPQAWRPALEAALRDRDPQVAARLTALREALTAPDPVAAVVAALPTPGELAALPPAEARAAALAALGERAYAAQGGRGPTATTTLASALAEPAARARVERVAWAFDGASRAAQARYRTWTWVFGVVGVLLLVIAAMAATGGARAWVPGLALVAAGAPLWFVARAALARVPDLAGGAPADVATLGVLAGLIAWSAWCVGRVAEAVGAAVAWVPLGVALAGATLVAGTLVAGLVAWLRPRQRSRF